MLIRRFVNASFRLLMRDEWSSASCQEYNDILTCTGGPLWYVLTSYIPYIYTRLTSSKVRMTAASPQVSPTISPTSTLKNSIKSSPPFPAQNQQTPLRMKKKQKENRILTSSPRHSPPSSLPYSPSQPARSPTTPTNASNPLSSTPSSNPSHHRTPTPHRPENDSGSPYPIPNTPMWRHILVW